jgi:hypothetical protein
MTFAQPTGWPAVMSLSNLKASNAAHQDKRHHEDRPVAARS